MDDVEPTGAEEPVALAELATEVLDAPVVLSGLGTRDGPLPAVVATAVVAEATVVADAGCPLGKAAVQPFLSVLRHFPNEVA